MLYLYELQQEKNLNKDEKYILRYQTLKGNSCYKVLTWLYSQPAAELTQNFPGKTQRDI